MAKSKKIAYRLNKDRMPYYGEDMTKSHWSYLGLGLVVFICFGAALFLAVNVKNIKTAKYYKAPISVSKKSQRFYNYNRSSIAVISTPEGDSYSFTTDDKSKNYDFLFNNLKTGYTYNCVVEGNLGEDYKLIGCDIPMIPEEKESNAAFAAN